MKQRGGWFLPDADNYFASIIAKAGGFQTEHLFEAFKYVTNWQCAVDCGAHVGFWTSDMVNRFKEVHAFEAARDSYECLLRNVSGENFHPHNLALGDKPGFCVVRNDKDRPGNTGARFISVKSTGVQMKTLDSRELRGVGLLKIDVEGFEYQVLKGAEETIKRDKPVIIMETDKKFSDRYGVEHGAAEALLIGMDYVCVAHMKPDKIFVHKQRGDDGSSSDSN